VKTLDRNGVDARGRRSRKSITAAKIRKDAIFARAFKSVARMERSVIRDCREASMPSRISLRSIRATLAVPSIAKRMIVLIMVTRFSVGHAANGSVEFGGEMNIVLRLTVAAAAIALIVLRIAKPETEINPVIFVYAFVALLAIFGAKGVVRLLEAFGLPKGRLEEIELPFLKYKFDEPAAEAPDAVATRHVTDGNVKPLLRPSTEAFPSMVVKLIPIETIMFYQVTSAMVLSTFTTGLFQAATVVKIQWALFLFSIAFTVIYLRHLRCSWLHAVLALAIFVGWALSLGGPFYSFSWYDPAYGALALLFLSLAAPLVYKATRVQRVVH
jgi:hypothetical protein